MSDTAGLRRRIATAGDLQSVVRTMKALAASSIGQYERSVIALADYYQTVQLGLGVCLRAAGPASVAQAAGRRSRGAGAIVFGSDQGLVGPFNDVVADHAIAALAALPGKPQLWAVGERLRARLDEAGLPILATFEVPVSVRGVASLVGELQLATEARRARFPYDELHLFYNRPLLPSAYEPVGERLLPLDAEWQRRLAAVPWPTSAPPEILGDVATTLQALVREHLFLSLFRACVGSLASENSSRLSAMERADKNIDEVLDELRSTFHLQRQAAIDEELFDVVSSYEVLSDGR